MRKIATILAAIGFSFCAGGTVYAKTLAGPKSEQGGHHHRHSGTSTHGVGRHMRAGNGPERHQAGIRHRSKRAETAPGAARALPLMRITVMVTISACRRIIWTCIRITARIMPTALIRTRRPRRCIATTASIRAAISSSIPRPAVA